MLHLPAFKDRHVAVLGLGKSGRAAAQVLAKNGAQVTAWDDNPHHLEHISVPNVRIVDLGQCDFSGIGDLVVSPGIPLEHPVVERARREKCRIIGDVELLAARSSQGRVLGITGTNGKSTTTALVDHILAANGVEVATGGNLGEPACALPPLSKTGTYVLELSSYQLDLIDRLVVDIAVFLNLSADHLERHGSMAGYIDAKRRIFRQQTSDSVAVIGVDDAASRDIYLGLKQSGCQRVIPVSGHQVWDGGVYRRPDGWLVDDTQNDETPVCDLERSAALPGQHNGQNAAAAFAACRAVGLSGHQIGARLEDFPGLPHRQEQVARINGIRFVNDSKATNTQATLQALLTYRNIYWIAGGQAKQAETQDGKSGFDALDTGLSHVCKAYLIGDAAPSLAKSLSGKIPAEHCGDVMTATEHAFAQAQAAHHHRSGDMPVILLSPACASFDQWENFEARGDAFRSTARRLASQSGVEAHHICV